MRAYLAARYSRRRELLAYANDLRFVGWTVTSRWLDGTHEASDVAPTAAQQAEWAKVDLSDIDEADVMVCFTEGPGEQPGRARGGRHVEFGYAFANRMEIHIVGPVENIFYGLPWLVVHETWPECLRYLIRDRVAVP